MALEAIFRENVFSFDKKDGLRFFQIHIHLEVQDDIRVTAELHSSMKTLQPIQINGSERTDDSESFLYTFKVQYLPPLILTCSLSLSYPSHHPPYFTIHAQWLNAQKISSLCQMLDNIWSEQPGQEVLYQWVEWLHSSSLSYLGFDDEVRLGPYDVLNIGDNRSISGSASLEADIPLIIRYNDERHQEAFMSNLHQCVICYDEYAGNFLSKCLS